jgi:hypothetical protein
MATLTYPYPDTLMVSVDLPDQPKALSEQPTLLEGVLRDILSVVSRFPDGLLAPSERNPVRNLVLDLATLQGETLRERVFFESCAAHPSLEPLVLDFVRAVNPSRMEEGPSRPRELWSSILAPAGSHAIVPLVLAHERCIDALVDHLRGVDLDHETFQGPLIAELWRRHGWTDAMLRLIALRGVDKAGQHGFEDLRWFIARGGLADLLATPAQIESFAELVHTSSRRERYRALYVAQAGQALFVGNPTGLDCWLSWFRATGLVFEPRDLGLPPPHEPGPHSSAERDFATVWDEAADCEELD